MLTLSAVFAAVGRLDFCEFDCCILRPPLPLEVSSRVALRFLKAVQAGVQIRSVRFIHPSPELMLRPWPQS